MERLFIGSNDYLQIIHFLTMQHGYTSASRRLSLQNVICFKQFPRTQFLNWNHIMYEGLNPCNIEEITPNQNRFLLYTRIYFLKTTVVCLAAALLGGHPLVSLLGNREADTLSSGQGHPWLVALANDEDVAQPGGEGVACCVLYVYHVE